MTVRRSLILAIGLCLVAATGLATNAMAQWVTNGVAVSAVTGNQQAPVSVSDGAQGTIIAWTDGRNGSNSDIYVQRLDATGTPQWTANGVLLCILAANRYDPSLIPDGAGGAIIAWDDFRSGTNYDIYAQHVLASGAVDPAWPADGRALCTATNDQQYPMIVTDGSGGAIVTWQDRRGADHDIYAQHVLASGAVDPAWPTDGLALCAAADYQRVPKIAEDGAGGAIVTWNDHRNGTDLDTFAQHVLAGGAVDPAWPTDGRALCTAANDQQSPMIVADGAGGAIVTWYDYRNGADFNIYAQRVLPTGAVDPTWPANGRALCTAADYQVNPSIVADGAGGAIVAWEDIRSGSNSDIYAQHVLATGVVDPVWPADGRALCAAALQQTGPTIVADGAGGAIATWLDLRNGANYDVYAQRVNASGTPQWVTNGTSICTAAGNQLATSIVSNGQGGAILAWQDSRSGADDDVYAQRVSAVGLQGFDFTITASAGPNGSISPEGVIGALSGGSVTFTMTPNSGFTVREVVVDDALAGPVTTFTFSNVTASHLIAAHFPSSGWVDGGAEVCTVPGGQGGSSQEALTTIADGAGGAFLAWSDSRAGTSFQEVYAQRVDASGIPQWTVDGVPVCTSAGLHYEPRLAPDGAGGVFVAWSDTRNGVQDVFAQRLNGAGAPQWATNGVAICTATADQYMVAIASDGANGAIIAWQDERLANNTDVYVQRVDAAGVPLWTTDGVVLCTAPNRQSSPAILPDGTGGAMVAWEDFRNLVDQPIYIQRVDASGVPQWTPDGVSLGTTAADGTPLIVTDGSGGAIIAWTRSQTNADDIFAQRVNAAGVPQWNSGGLAVSTAANIQRNPALVPDGAGGAIVTWSDRRSGTNYDIYAQRLGAAGLVQWAANGIPLCTVPADQIFPALVSDGQGGAIAVWMDRRSSNAYDLYAQRVDPAGATQWTADGAAVSTSSGSQRFPRIVSDNSSGAIVAWNDSRSGGANLDVYAQRVRADGLAGFDYSIVASAGAGGTISPAGTRGAMSGSSLNFTIAPATGYHIQDVLVDLGSVGAVTGYTFSNIAANHTISASFAINTYQLSATAGPNGTLSFAGGAVNYGSTVPVYVQPNEGAVIEDVIVDGFSVGGVVAHTFTNVTATHSISATFQPAIGLIGAGWVPNGKRVSAVDNDAYEPHVIADGLGGAIVAWFDLGFGGVVKANQVSVGGIPGWNADDGVVLVGEVTRPQDSPSLASDGAGGAIVAWHDGRPGATSDIYAQRITGTILWDQDDVAICTAVNEQNSVVVVPDGSGGAIIAWDDYRSGTDHDIYAQRVNAAGITQWTANGVAVCAAGGDQYGLEMIADGLGGAILAWSDRRGGSTGDIYAQRINGSGVAQWTVNGVAVCAAAGEQNEVSLASLGAGSAVMCWRDARGGAATDIYAQRLDAGGAAQWGAGGLLTCGAAGIQQRPVVATNSGAGMSFVVWEDQRGGGSDLYVERITLSGVLRWGSGGAAVCTASGDQTAPVIAEAAGSGVTVAWEDARAGVNHHIYARRIDATGLPQWAANGVPVGQAAQSQSAPSITDDGSGGAFVAWEDSRPAMPRAIYVQRVNALGTTGFDHTVTTSSSGNGTVSPAGSFGVFDGASHQIALAPATGYRVGNVSVNGVSNPGSEAMTIAAITGDRTCQVSFVLNDYAQSNASFVVASYGCEDPQGNCLTRGWTGEDLASRVYAHVSERFLVNSGGMAMDTRALWFGADSTTAPDQTRNWVSGAGYGNNWSQRLTSPLIDRNANPAAILSFDASVDLQPSGTLNVVPVGVELFGIQGQKSDGTWAFLFTRFTPQSEGTFTKLWVNGHGVCHAEVRLAEDGNESIGLATSTRLRVVVQTDSTGSQEDGLVTHVGGAAVVDNLTLKQGGTDIIPSVDFESGSLGSWTLSAMNGVLRGPGPDQDFTRDLPAPATSVALERAWDTNDAGCVWTFASPGDTLANGTFARLTSPWFALPTPAAGAVIAFTAKLNTLDQRRGLKLYARGKNGGDLHPRFMAPLAQLLNSGVAGGDANAPLWSGREYRLPQDFTGSSAADSIQLVFQVEDRGEAVTGGLAGRPQTRLPILDDLRVLQVAVDADSDGVANALDGCPSQNAAGEDADTDGCVDATATLHHVETWAIPDRPIRFALSLNGAPAIVDGSDLAALRAGFAVWQGVPGATVPLVEMPLTTQTKASALDGVNLVTFEDDYPFPSNVIAITPTTSFTRRTPFNDRLVVPGQIVDADMIFNPNASFSTSTTGSIPGAFDLQSVTAHEAGHFLGISHSGVQDATMFPVLLPGSEAANLADDDRAAIASAYPAASLATGFGTIGGHVFRGGTSQPIPGALVFAVKLDGGNAPLDTTSSDYSREDGSYALRRLPAGSYAVRVTPLDGEVPGLLPGAISERVRSIARADFAAEWWDAAEGSADDPDAKSPIVVAAGQTIAGMDVVTNPDALPPTIASLSPAADTTGVRIDTAVLIRFSEAIADSTISPSFFLRKTGQSGRLGGRGSILTGGRAFVFTPSSALEANANYEVRISTALTDRGGQHLASDYIRHFGTQSQPMVAIGSIAPAWAPRGAIVTILGVGFDAATPATNRVAFTLCGICPPETTAAEVATPTSLVVRVPASAASGSVRVIVGGQVSGNTAQFDVLGADVSVAPSPSGSPATLLWSPTDVALAPNGNTAYVVGEGGFATIDLTLGHTPVQRQSVASRHVALAPDGKRVYVTQPDLGQIVEFDADPLSGDFGTVCPTCAAIVVAGTPDGIALAPGGRRAYVTDRDSARVYEIDTDVTSATRGSAVREISVAGLSLTGGLAVDATGRALLVATRDAGTLRLDLETDAVTPLHPAASAGAVTIAPDNREVVFAADDGTLYTARGTLGTGTVTTGTVTADGSPRDVAFDPGGGVAYLADLASGHLEVMGMDSTVATTYHRVTGSVATGLSPVAVAASANGALIAVANAGSRSVSFYSRVAGLSLVRLNPDIASPGTRVSAIATGGSFSGTPSVDVADQVVGSTTAVGSGVSFVVPFTYQRSVPVTLVDINGDRTLSLPLAIVAPIETVAPARASVAITGPRATCASDSGYAAVGPVVTSPDGELLAIVSLAALVGSCDAHPAFELFRISGAGASGLDLPLTRTTLPMVTVLDAVFTPDSRRLWVAVESAGAHRIEIFDADPASPTFGAALDSLPESLVGRATALACDAARGLMCVAARLDHVVSRLTPAGTLLDTTSTGSQEVRSVAAARDGRFVFVGTEDRAYVLDSGTRAVLGSNLPHPGDAIVQIEGTENGRRAVARGSMGTLAVLNLDAGSGAIGQQVDYGPPLAAGDVLGPIAAAPDGHSVLVTSANRDSLFEVDVDGGTMVPGSTPTGRPFAGLARSVDGRQMWALIRGGTPAAPDSLVLYGAAPATRLSQVSGDRQSGPAGATLPIPVRVQVTDTFGHPQEGVVLRFALPDTSSGKIDFATGATVVDRVTNVRGEAEVSWTMPGMVRSCAMAISGLGVPGQLTVAASSTPGDAVAAPVVLALGPANGSVGIYAGTGVYARFTQRMDSTSVVNHMRLTANGNPVTGRYSIPLEGRAVHFRPDQPLPFAASCTLTIDPGAYDLDGQTLADGMSTSFTVQGAPPVALSVIDPPAASPGANVVLLGQGFDPDPGANTVLMNGQLAKISSASDRALVVRVPQAAVSGPITVQAGAGTSNAVLFDVLEPHPGLLPPSASQFLGPGVQSLAITPDGQYLYVANTWANTVTAVRLSDLAVLRIIPVGRAPVSIGIVAESKRAYVANAKSNTVSVIDIDPADSAAYHTVVKTVEVGKNPIDLAVSPLGPSVIVLNAGDSTLSVIDAYAASGASDFVVRTVACGSGGTQIVVAPDGTMLYVATATGILVVDLKTDAVVRTVACGSGGTQIVVAPDGALLFALSGDGTVLIIDIVPGSASYNQVVRTVACGSGSTQIIVSPDGASLFVIYHDQNQIRAFEITTGSEGGADAGVVPGDPVDLKPLGTVSVGKAPVDLAVEPRGTFAAVINQGDGTVQILPLAEEPAPLTVELDLVADRFNLGAFSPWATAYLEPPAPYTPAQLALSTLRLNALATVDTTGPLLAGDHDGDTRADLGVSIRHAALAAVVPDGVNVVVTISGTIDTSRFVARDTIPVLRRTIITSPTTGQVISPAAGFQLTYDRSRDSTALYAAVLHAVGANGAWTLDLNHRPNTGQILWTAPGVLSDSVRVAVVLVNAENGDGTVTGALGMSGYFTTNNVVSVTDVRPTVIDLIPPRPNPASGVVYFRFGLPMKTEITLELFDVQGRLVRTLARGPLEPGWHTREWRGELAGSGQAGTGIYFVRLRVEGRTWLRRIVWMR